METGLRHRCTVRVGEEMLACHVKSGSLRVYATPMLAALMEQTCMECVQPHLEAGCCTVGIRMDVEHSAPTPLGMTVVCECELTAVEGRRLVFQIQAFDECGPVGRATHERFIVYGEKFQTKADSRLDRLTCEPILPGCPDFDRAEELYLSAFPEIERHPVEELCQACGPDSDGECEWLAFRNEDGFVGMAYMILYRHIAYVLYLAVEERSRNKNYGAGMLRVLRSRYRDRDFVLLIESLRENCSNLDIRIRRRGFYLRNGFKDTGFVQPCHEGTVIYDILSTADPFDAGRYMDFVRHYPLSNTLTEIYRG